jgi:histidine triad (HIT) family protein
MITAQKVAKGLQKVLSDHDGITLSLADGLSAGQDVPHTHLHVIPRQPTDGFGWRRLGRPSEGGTLELLGQQIRTAVGSDS